MVIALNSKFIIIIRVIITINSITSAAVMMISFIKV